MDRFVEFQSALREAKPAVVNTALLYARDIAYPDLELKPILKDLQDLALVARLECRDRDSVSAAERARRLSDFLFHEVGFVGNETDYYDPNNSMVNVVLARKKGIPITLSAIYLDIASRIDLDAYGVGLPGHFVVAVEDNGSITYFDPFYHGEQRSLSECAALVSRITGYQGSLRQEWLAPVTERAMIERMLSNLYQAYTRLEQWSKALATLQHLHLLLPEQPSFVREMGLLHRRLGRQRQAADRLQQYLRMSPQAADAPAVAQIMNDLLNRLVSLN